MELDLRASEHMLKANLAREQARRLSSAAEYHSDALSGPRGEIVDYWRASAEAETLIALYHDQLAEKYVRATQSPGLIVPPDPPEPRRPPKRKLVGEKPP
jgi:hypothetical protein